MVLSRQVQREKKSLFPFFVTPLMQLKCLRECALLTPQRGVPFCFLPRDGRLERAFWNEDGAVEKGWEVVHQSKTSPEAVSKQGQVPGCVHIRTRRKPWGNIFVFLPPNFKNIIHHSKVGHLRRSSSFPGITSPIKSSFFSLQGKENREFAFPMCSERNTSQKPQVLGKNMGKNVLSLTG